MGASCSQEKPCCKRGNKAVEFDTEGEEHDKDGIEVRRMTAPTVITEPNEANPMVSSRIHTHRNRNTDLNSQQLKGVQADAPHVSSRAKMVQFGTEGRIQTKNKQKNVGSDGADSIYHQLESIEGEAKNVANPIKIQQSSYTGPKKGILKHGYGVQNWSDGSKFEGNWMDGKAHGQGKFTNGMGDVYKGQFRDDKANGRGVLVSTKGRYEGTWWDDKQHGQGIQLWSGGGKYQGGYQKGKKHGHGRYVWPDSTEYTGDWAHGFITGYGRAVWSDGRRYEGQWTNNQKHGKGKHSWPDGRIYQGQYRHDRRNGYGKLTLPDGSVYEGEWSDNFRNGRGVEKTAKGVSKQGQWQQGRFVRWTQ